MLSMSKSRAPTTGSHFDTGRATRTHPVLLPFSQTHHSRSTTSLSSLSLLVQCHPEYFLTSALLCLDCHETFVPLNVCGVPVPELCRSRPTVISPQTCLQNTVAFTSEQVIRTTGPGPVPALPLSSISSLVPLVHVDLHVFFARTILSCVMLSQVLSQIYHGLHIRYQVLYRRAPSHCRVAELYALPTAH